MGSVLLPYAPASVAVARRRLAADLTAAGIFAGAVGDAVLVVSELLSNAIRHARPLPGASVQVAWVLADDAVEVAVSDGGAPTRPTPAQATVSSLGGRGLDIVEYLARTWGVRTDEAGVTVWAVLAAPPDRHRPGATPVLAPVASHAARRNSEPDWLYLPQRVRSGGPAGERPPAKFWHLRAGAVTAGGKRGPVPGGRQRSRPA